MRKLSLCVAVLAAALMMLVSAESANAQPATRTWVSGVGVDSNPCSRTAPCKTFAGAYSVTTVGGEINCLDPGGYGSLTIDHSIGIICDFTEGGVLVSGTPGMTVNAGVNDTVILRGLDFNGAGQGTQGINFVGGGTLIVEKSTIENFTGNGIDFTNNNAATLIVTDVAIRNNAANGILVAPTAGAGANVVLDQARLISNTLAGFRLDNSNTSNSTISASVSNSVSSKNAGAGFTAFSHTPNTNIGVRLVLEHSVSSFNATGLNSNGPSAVIVVGSSMVAHNGTDLNVLNTGVVATKQNNDFEFNAVDHTASLTVDSLK
jgi:hypothetical protein